MIIDRTAYDAMIVHMLQAAPHEGVGLLAGPKDRPACSRDTNGDCDCGRPLCPECGGGGGRIDRWVPLTNTHEHPRARFQLDPLAQVAAYEACDADGRWPWIMVHSHPCTSAAPSEMDIRYATDPKLLHLVVSLAGAKPFAVLWRLDPTKVGTGRCSRVRYRVADLGRKEYPATDLTRDVSGA